MEIKAIYIADINYKDAPVFTYSKLKDSFEYYLEDDDNTIYIYPSELIYCDSDWVVFKVENEIVTKINRDDMAKLISLDVSKINLEDYQ